jgi:hypothetical protein
MKALADYRCSRVCSGMQRRVDRFVGVLAHGSSTLRDVPFDRETLTTTR